MSLMAGNQSKLSSANSNISMNHENFKALLQAFLETRDEANRLVFSNN